MAFMWIKENIASFGGDPALITLLGHSAGADSILYHMASPRTNGLFHRAIIMSPRNVWGAINADESTSNKIEETSREVARSIGCIGDADAILRCMQSRPLDDILKFYTPNNKTLAIGPVVENFLSPSEQYLPLDLYHALVSDSKATQIDVLFGTVDLDAINNDELDYHGLQSKDAAAVLEYAKYQLIPKILRSHDLDGSPAPVISALVEAVLWEYWGPRGQRTDKDVFHVVEMLARMKTSAQWGAGAALLAAKLARRVARLYVYRYSQAGQVDLQGRQLNYSGAVHGTDFIALLGDGIIQQLARRRPSISEQRASAYIRKHFVHFIKFGSPTSTDEWPQYRVGAAYLHDLQGDVINPTKMNSPGRDVAFWLQYLPYINSLHSTTERTERLNSNKEDTRLRGAVYALVAVAVVLLALLGLGAALLRRERRQNGSIDD